MSEIHSTFVHSYGNIKSETINRHIKMLVRHAAASAQQPLVRPISKFFANGLQFSQGKATVSNTFYTRITTEGLILSVNFYRNSRRELVEFRIEAVSFRNS